MLMKIEDDHCVIHGAENEHAQFGWLTMVLKMKPFVVVSFHGSGKGHNHCSSSIHNNRFNMPFALKYLNKIKKKKS